MSTLFSHPVLRRLFLIRLLEVTVLVTVVGASIVAHGMVRDARLRVIRREVQLGANPQYVLALSQLQGQLRERAHDIERILHLVEDPNDIVGFIEDIEAGARSRGITLTVSRIDEVQELDEAGEIVEPTGPFRSIKLTLTGLGDGAALLEYVHDLEQGQRLMVLQEWDIVYDPTSAVAIRQSEAARQIEETTAEAPVIPLAELNAEVILLVHNEKYSL